MSQPFILAGLFNLDPSQGPLMGQMFARADLQDAAPTAHTAEFRNAYRLRLSYVLASPILHRAAVVFYGRLTAWGGTVWSGRM
jgi:hypothetical protein